MYGNKQPMCNADQIALSVENERLSEAIEKALQLLDVRAISAVQSLMGPQASADLARAVRILNAAVPGRKSDQSKVLYARLPFPLPQGSTLSPTRTP